MKPSFPHKNSGVALGIKVAPVLFATLAIYHQDLTIIGNEAIGSELLGHTLAIPFLLAYLLYRKRKMLKAVIPLETSKPTIKTILIREVVGAMLCVLSFLLYWHGSYTFHPLEYHMVSLPLFAAGLILIIFSTKTLKVLAFPIAFLLFLTPPPLEIFYSIGANLSIVSSEASYAVLKAISLPVTITVQYGTPIITLAKPESAPLAFAIDIACSGLYSLIGFTIFAVFIAYIARGTGWRRATIFLTGLALIYALNIIRIIAIVLIGYQYGTEAAMQAFHLLGGWILIFTGTLILLTLSEKILKIRLFATEPKLTPCNYCNQSVENKQHFCTACGRFLNPMNIKLSRRDLSKVFVLIICAILVINLQVPVFALTEGPAGVTIQTLGREQAMTQILPEVPGYAIKFAYRDERFEKIAKQDASLAYVYTPIETTKTNIFVTMEIAKTRSRLHRWEVCLITWPQRKGYQLRVTQLSLRDVQLLQNPPITARYFAFQDKKYELTQVVLYWYERAYFNTGSSQETKHVKISLIAFAKTPQDVPIIEERLLPFAKAIANYWQPVKTWSQIALLISQNGINLIAITIALLTTILSYQVIKNRGKKKSNLELYNKLALQEERLVLQAVHQAAKKGEPTGIAIASSYHTLTAKTIELDILIEKLQGAEEASFILKDITRHEDEPMLTWKSQISFPNMNS